VLARRPLGEQIEFGYDYLILAAGVRQSYFGHDEYAAFAPGMKTIELYRPVAGDGQPVGDHAEADDLRADRRAGRRAYALGSLIKNNQARPVRRAAHWYTSLGASKQLHRARQALEPGKR